MLVGITSPKSINTIQTEMMMAKYRLILYAILFLSLWSNTASSVETFYPLVKYACDKQADIVTITNSILKGDEGKNYHYSDKFGTYSPWDMVEIDNTASRAKILAKKKIIKQCELSSGTYTITLEPKTFGKYLDGRCGASISASLTVTYDGIDILEKTHFEDYCHGNTPIITRVTVFGKTVDVKIKRIPKYKFY